MLTYHASVYMDPVDLMYLWRQQVVDLANPDNPEIEGTQTFSAQNGDIDASRLNAP